MKEERKRFRYGNVSQMVKKKKNPCHIKCDMNKRWEFRKPWCSAGLYLSDCVCWSVLLIPAIRAELQPASASQKHRSSTGLPLLRPVPRAKYTKNKVRTSYLLLSRTKGQVVIFSVTPVLVKSGKMKVKHCAKCVTQWTGYLELISFVLEFHYYCCALWALLRGWLSALVRFGIPCAWPCTSREANSPGALTLVTTHQMMQQYCSSIFTGREWAPIKQPAHLWPCCGQVLTTQPSFQASMRIINY